MANYDGPIFSNDKDIINCYVNIYQKDRHSKYIIGNPQIDLQSAQQLSEIVKNSMFHGFKKTLYRIRIIKHV